MNQHIVNLAKIKSSIIFVGIVGKHELPKRLMESSKETKKK